VRVAPFSIAIGDDVLDDLRVRLERARWPSDAPGEPWSRGTDLGWLRALCAYWADGFDWRARERRLNAYDQFVAEVGGVRVHFVWVRRGGTPLILTHGWPSTFTEWLSLADLLPGFDLVIPSLPGYGFSERPPVCTTRDVAALWHELMRGLGYERYGACGGDFGAAVTTYLGLDHADAVIGIHLCNLDNAPASPASLSAAEVEYSAAVDHWDATERGYSFIQGTRPQTVAYGLNDSPAGLAAWILEKWRAWGDTGGDVTARFGRDFLLELVTLYWATETIDSSLRDYRDNRDAGTAVLSSFVEVPTGIASFHSNFVSEGVVPREWASRMYNVVRFEDMPRGGHFAAVEEPGLLAAEIAAFFS
jgi:pimeloyl-ACP methyl ester carboxylesterase